MNRPAMGSLKSFLIEQCVAAAIFRCTKMFLLFSKCQAEKKKKKNVRNVVILKKLSDDNILINDVGIH